MRPEIPENTEINLDAEINETFFEEANHDPCKMNYLVNDLIHCRTEHSVPDHEGISAAS